MNGTFRSMAERLHYDITATLRHAPSDLHKRVIEDVLRSVHELGKRNAEKIFACPNCNCSWCSAWHDAADEISQKERSK
jgi:hypothetical protein